MAGRILLAEDVEANIVLFRAILETDGHRLAVARDGAEAVEFGLTEPYDLIFMDLNLPILTGTEAAEQLRAAGVRAPILALTAEDDPRIEAACRTAGMNAFVRKPVSPSDLRMVAHRWTNAVPA